MTTSLAKAHLLLMDACVLIDFVRSDHSVFKLLAEHVGAIYVVRAVAEEVQDVHGAEALQKLGLIIIEPTLDDLYDAANTAGPISFQDRLCLLCAKREGFTCVTNDTRLRKECIQEKVPIRWGLRLLIDLHEAGGISVSDALRIAQLIAKNNPKHISRKILDRLKAELREE